MARGFRERNAEVATAVAVVLGDRGFGISEAAISAGIESSRLPGRLERMPGTIDPPVWIDGAHNEDKLAALNGEVLCRFGEGPLPIVVFGMLRSKDPSPLLANLGSAASSIVLTEPFVHGRESFAADTLTGALTKSRFAGGIHVEPDPDAAVRYAEVIARQDGAAVVVTGSMYLAGQVRRRWFRDLDIILQRTPWPISNLESDLAPSRPFSGLVGDKPNGKRDEAADHQESAGTDELVVR
jgi:dihydrofolate synthase/folylpolyglutamate synthase